MAFFETEGGSSAVNCVGCAFFRNGRGTGQTTRGGVDWKTRPSSGAAIEPNVSVFFGGDRRFRSHRAGRPSHRRGKADAEDIAEKARNAQRRACTYVHVILRFAFVSRRGRRGVVRQIHHRHIRLRFRFRLRRGGGLGRDGLLGTAPEEAAYVARHRARRGTVSRASSEAFDKPRVPGSGEIAERCLRDV